MLQRRTYRRKHEARAQAVKVGGAAKVKNVTSDESLRRPIKMQKQRRRKDHQQIRREYP